MNTRACKLIFALAGALCIGISFAATSLAGKVDYLQLVFAHTPPKCGVEYRQWRDGHVAARRKDVTVQCFSAVERKGAAARLPPYLIQLTASDSAALEFRNAPGTATYRALGAEQLAKDIPGANPTPLGTGTPRDYELIVFSNPMPGQEEVYNDWYDHQHVPDVLRVSGFVSARRYETADAGNASGYYLPRYLVVFKVKSADLAATGAEIGARLRDGRTRMSPSFDGGSAVGLFVTPL